MADFCNQCADELGFPRGDLANLGGEEKLKPNYYWLAICEGCGFTSVDDEGNCVIEIVDEGHFKTHKEKK